MNIAKVVGIIKLQSKYIHSLYSVVYVILCLAVFVELLLVTDGQKYGQKDRHTATAYTALV